MSALLESLLALALLAVVAAGAGLLLRAACGRTQPALGGATTALLGACALCALLPNLFQLGLPRGAVLAVTYIGAAAGWVLGWQRRWLVPVDRWAAVAAGLFALALWAPFVLAATQPPLTNDAVIVWWPKVAEVAAGVRPDLQASDLVHVSQFYPRGLAWLTTVAWPWGEPSGGVARATPLLMTWLLAQVMTAMARQWTRPGPALLPGLAYVLLPDIAQQVHAGMCDTGIAAAVLLGGFGLQLRRRHALGYAIAVVAGCGAVSIKEEGSLVLLVVLASFAFDVWQRPQQRRAALGWGAAALVLLPFAAARAQVPQTRLDTLGLLLAHPDTLLLRAAAVVENVARALGAPATLRLDLEGPFGMPVQWSGWVVLLSLGVLVLPGLPRPVPVRTAIVLLLGAVLVYVASSVDVRWHVRTTLPRLMLEVAPLLLVAATGRLLAGGAAVHVGGRRAP